MIYTASMDGIAISAAQDLFELLAATDHICEILRFEGGQISDVGDAEAESLPITFEKRSGAVTSGSGGAAVTEQPTQSGFAAAGATVERNNTTRATGGTGIVLASRPFSLQNGDLWVPAEGEPVIVSPGEYFIVGLPTAPADPITGHFTLTWREIGG